MMRYLSFLLSKGLRKVTPNNLIIITGCDSGLGLNLALQCYSLNMTVLAGCLDNQSEGANYLRKCCPSERMRPIKIDLRKIDEIRTLETLASTILSSNKNLKLTALINNAGVMCFGEFEWQTRSLIENQIYINLLGTMSLTKQLLPLIRSHKGRIINVTSHCALESLPGLAPYAASKAGLKFWNDALRIEMKKYGVYVINFIPGSFVTVSNIIADQQKFAQEMQMNFTDKQWYFYEDYFTRYQKYLQSLSGKKSPAIIKDNKLFKKFKSALLDTKPKAMYKHEPLRYTFYHTLFKIVPTSFRDYLIEKFISMPKFKI